MGKLSPIRDLAIKLGTVRGASNASVEFGEKEFATHMAVYGGTGKGKTKFLELIVRQLIDQRRGACIIDPHGDLVEDLLTYIMQRKDAMDPRLLKRIHYFQLGLKDCGFSFDPFHYRPSVDGDYDYKDWLKAKVESVARVIIRKQGESDFQGKPRLERFLTNVLYGVGTTINDNGDHLPLADAEVLLSSDKQYQPVFDAVANLLPTEVRSDFLKVRNSSPRQQEDWVESTIGRLRSFLSPIVKSLFTNEAEEPVKFREIVEQQGIMLVNLRRTRSFTLDQSNALGGLFINEILEAVETADRTRRVPFFLFIDEASRFVGQDLMDALGQFRKWKLSLCLAVQDLSSLKGKEIDMTPKVMSQCGIQVSFQQKFPEDVDALAHLFGYPTIDYSRLIHEVDRPDGYDEIETVTYSKGGSTTNTSGESISNSEGTSNGITSGKSVGKSQGITTGTSQGDDPKSTRRTSSESRSRSESESRSSSQSKSNSRSESQSISNSESQTWSESIGKQFLSRTYVDRQDTGRLITSVDDQLHKVKTLIRRLGLGEAIALVDGVDPFVLKVHSVETPFASVPPEKRAETLEKYKRLICRSHKYCVKNKRLTEAVRLASFSANALKPRSEKTGEVPFHD